MPLSGYRILIVEDEALIALALSHGFEDLHAIVVGSVNNLADARKAVSEAKIDCAVLDVHLRGESIAALIPELDARHIPRVFMTAYPEHDLPKAWTVWPVLEKPMVRGDLLRAIERVVDQHPQQSRAGVSSGHD
jgi:DNA-binding NtrC family response regulator